MKKIKCLAVRMVAGCALLLMVPVSTFAEEWTRTSTAERILGEAAGLILNSGRGASARGRAKSVALWELERILRERALRRRVHSGRSPQVRPRHGTVFSPELVMPVVGVEWLELRDSFGDARSGGRSHMGVDIFAPRWTEVVAATAGTLSSIGNGARSGRSLWLAGRDGRSYFYAHLQDLAEGAYNGRRVAPGELIGYVGNSGNASGSPPHLHFEVRDGDRVVNPYYALADARPAHSSVPVYGQ